MENKEKEDNKITEFTINIESLVSEGFQVNPNEDIKLAIFKTNEEVS